MNFDRRQAKALSTPAELKLFDNSRPPRLNKFTEAELKNMVTRGRTLRDKLRDLAEKETRSRQSEKGLRGTKASERSIKKANLYSEVYEAFVSRLAALSAGEAKAKEVVSKKPSRKVRNIEARADRTAARHNLKQVKENANAIKRKTARTAESSKSAPKAAGTKMAEPKELLASAAISRMPVKPGIAASTSGRSAKATTASKTAVDKSVGEDQKPQTAGRKPNFQGKILETRMARSGQTRKRAHISSVGKRHQARRDSK